MLLYVWSKFPLTAPLPGPAMKREREDDAEASSDDEMGPMPAPDAQTTKKKRKGTSPDLRAASNSLTFNCRIQSSRMKRYSSSIYPQRISTTRASCIGIS